MTQTEDKLRARVLFYWLTAKQKHDVKVKRATLMRLLVTDDLNVCLAAAKALPLPWLAALHDGCVQFAHKRSATAQRTADVQRVFDHWIAVTGKTARTKLSDRRASKINARLSDGYTVPQLCSVADAVMQSDWHIGINPNNVQYTGIDVIYRSADHVDKWLSKTQRVDLFDDVRKRTAKRRDEE